MYTTSNKTDHVRLNALLVSCARLADCSTDPEPELMTPRVIRGSSATVPSTSSPTRAINVESDDDNDEDAFMRNKSSKTWQTLNKFNKSMCKTYLAM